MNRNYVYQPGKIVKYKYKKNHYHESVESILSV